MRILYMILILITKGESINSFSTENIFIEITKNQSFSYSLSHSVLLGWAIANKMPDQQRYLKKGFLHPTHPTKCL